MNFIIKAEIFTLFLGYVYAIFGKNTLNNIGEKHIIYFMGSIVFVEMAKRTLFLSKTRN